MLEHVEIIIYCFVIAELCEKEDDVKMSFFLVVLNIEREEEDEDDDKLKCVVIIIYCVATMGLFFCFLMLVKKLEIN
jgi:hypothetical protein